MPLKKFNQNCQLFRDIWLSLSNEHMLFAHHAYRLIYKYDFFLKFLFLLLEIEWLHRNRHLFQHLVNFYFVRLELSQCLKSFILGHKFRARRLARNSGISGCHFFIFFFLSFLLELLKVFWDFAEVISFLGRDLWVCGRFRRSCFGWKSIPFDRWPLITL